MGTPPPIMTANLGMADTLLLMVLALVVFGPRRLPQIGRQIGKLMYEFRKASNDFKFQMEEELRQSEEADRRKKEEEARQKALAATPPAPPLQPSAEAASLAPATPVTPDTPTEGTYSGETTHPDPAAESAHPVETIEDLTAAAIESPALEDKGTQPEDQAARTEDEATRSESLTASAVEAARLRIQPPSTGEVVAANPPGRVPQQAELFASPSEPEEPAAPQSPTPDAASDAPSDAPSDAHRSESAAHHG